MLTHVFLSWTSKGDLDGEIEAIAFLSRGTATVTQTIPLSQHYCRFEVLQGGKYHVEVRYATSQHRWSRAASVDFVVPTT